jgi:dihydroorotase-like cyclic amidohydrolase
MPLHLQTATVIDCSGAPLQPPGIIDMAFKVSEPGGERHKESFRSADRAAAALVAVIVTPPPAAIDTPKRLNLWNTSRAVGCILCMFFANGRTEDRAGRMTEIGLLQEMQALWLYRLRPMSWPTPKFTAAR